MFPASPAYARASPIVMLLIMCTLHGSFAYSYDYAEILFSTALLYLLMKGRWQAYILCFALGTYAKETAMFAIFFYAINAYPRLPFRQYIGLGLLQICIFAAIRAAIVHYFADLPAAYDENQAYSGSLQLNFLYLFNYNDNYSLASFAVMIILMTYRWYDKPLFLRSALWMLVPNGAAYFLTCTPGEYRDLLWSMPVIGLLVTHSIVTMAGFDKPPQDKERMRG